MAALPQNWVREYDAIVIGAGYGGLITAAILARNGLKTVVVEKTHRVGGRIGCCEWNGYWLDFGHRDDEDFEDNWLIYHSQSQYYKQAAEAAGVEINVVPAIPAAMIHSMDDDRIVYFSPDDPEAPMRLAAEAFGASEEQLVKLQTVLANLLQDDPEKWVPVSFGQWLPEAFPSPEDEVLRDIMVWIAKIMFVIPPENFSVGRFMKLMLDTTVTAKVDDPEVGGMQGLVEPYARAIRKYGGEIEFGLQAEEILMEGNKVSGIVARDEASVVREFHAPVVIYALPIWRIFHLLDESHFPKQVVTDAWELEKAFRGDSICLNIGISRPPTIRKTGQPDDYMGYHAFMGHGANGWIFNSISSAKTAPSSKQLLWAGWFTGGPGTGCEEPFKSFAEAKARVDIVHDYMHKYYSDLDEITEWVNYQWHKGYWGSAAMWWPIRRSPLRVDGIDGLYFVGSTVEVDGQYGETDSNSALQATKLILQRV